MGVPIFISALDKNSPGFYEKFSLWRKLVNVIWYPTIWLLAFFTPLGNLLFRQSSVTRDIKKNATNYLALEHIYSYEDHLASLGWWDKLWTKIWLNLINGTSARNRLKLVIEELDGLVRQLAEGGKTEIHITSLASGSARAAIEIAKRAILGEYGSEVKVYTMLIDRDRNAIKLAQKRIAQNHLQERCFAKVGNALDIEKAFTGFSPDIVEIVGLLDYFTEEGVVEYLRLIGKQLESPAWVLAGNINFNPEIPFIKKIITWDMFYKTPKTMAKIIHRAGFSPDGWYVVCEPQNVHAIAIASTR